MNDAKAPRGIEREGTRQLYIRKIMMNFYIDLMMIQYRYSCTYFCRFIVDDLRNVRASAKRTYPFPPFTTRELLAAFLIPEQLFLCCGNQILTYISKDGNYEFRGDSYRPKHRVPTLT